MAIPGYVVPGQIICPVFEKVDPQSSAVRKYVPGHGVALAPAPGNPNAVTLAATLVGRVAIEPLAEDPSTGPSSTHKKMTVHTFQVSVQDKFYSPATLLQYAQNTNTANNQSKVPLTRQGVDVLPAVGSVVLARVTKLALRQAAVEILAVEHSPTESALPTPFQPDSVPVSAESGAGLNGLARGTVPRSNVSSAASWEKAVALLGGAHGGEGSFGGGAGGGAAGGEGGGSGSGGGANGGSTEVGEGFGGVIRVQDVRMTERDKVKMAESFRPGDIVRATVVSTF